MEHLACKRRGAAAFLMRHPLSYIPRRYRIMMRRHGPEALIWRRRIAIAGGAIVIGLVALLFAALADKANELFHEMIRLRWWLPLLLTPAGFAAFVWLTLRFAPEAKGSGIPQVRAATRDPARGLERLASTRTAIAKFFLTIGTLLLGASVGREGSTVQIAATIMGHAHRWMRIPLRSSVYIAGGAAGVAVAFFPAILPAQSFCWAWSPISRGSCAHL